MTRDVTVQWCCRQQAVNGRECSSNAQPPASTRCFSPCFGCLEDHETAKHHCAGDKTTETPPCQSHPVGKCTLPIQTDHSHFQLIQTNPKYLVDWLLFRRICIELHNSRGGFGGRVGSCLKSPPLPVSICACVASLLRGAE